MRMKRSLALIMVVVLCAAVLPASAFAVNAELSEPVSLNEEAISEEQKNANTEETLVNEKEINPENTQDAEAPDSQTEDNNTLDLPEFTMPETKANEEITSQQDKAVKVAAQTGEESMTAEGFKYREIEGGLELCAYTGTAEDVVIPDTIDGKAVVAIGDMAFWINDSIKSVVIGENIQRIGEEAFYSCNLLSQITFSNSVREIGKQAFYHCQALSKVRLPDNIIEISESAFASCIVLSQINIPGTITKINDRVFNGCNELIKIEIPASIKAIGEFAIPQRTKIYGTSGSAAEVYATKNYNTFINANSHHSGDFYYEDYQYYGENGSENGVKILAYEGSDTELKLSTLDGKKILCIGASAFKGNKTLQSLTIGNEVKIIEPYVFSLCENLKAVNLSEGLESISAEAFCNTGIEVIEIPNSVKILYSGVFSNCHLLKKITTGTGITEIPYEFASGCSTLENIVFKGNITKIEEKAFKDCLKLRKIDISESVIEIGRDAFVQGTTIVHGKAGSYVEQYTKENGIVFVGENTQKLGDFYYEAVEGGVRITGYTGNASKLTLPEKLGNQPAVEIGVSVFANNSNLESVIVGGSIKTIGDYAFTNNNNLKDVTISGNVKTIGDYAFANNNSLKSVTVGGSVEIIGNNAFKNCGSLMDIHLNEGLQKIESGAFYQTGLTSLSLPDSLAEMGISAFEGCKKLTFAHVGSGFKAIPNRGFWDCGELEKFEFSENSALENIGDLSFSHCVSLQEIKFPVSLKSIGSRAFGNCQKLKNVVIPAVQSIWRDQRPYGDSFNECYGVIFFGTRGTDAEAFAKEKNIPFVTSETSRDGAYYYEDVAGGVRIVMAEDPGQKDIPAALGGKTVVEIGQGAFANDADLETISGNNLRTIGDVAFGHCEKIKRIKLGDQLETIGRQAFIHCENLMEAKVPNSTKAMGIGAFTYCESMTSVTLGTGLETIEAETFSWTGLKTATLPISIKNIERYAFSNTLEDLIIPEGVQSVTLKKDAFGDDGSRINYMPNLKSLRTVYLPDGVTTIEDKAFGERPSIYLTIHGNTGSAAETFAQKNNITFSTEIWQQGDVNKDGSINASDALMDLQHAVKELTLTGSDFIRGDVNKDNIVNASDGLQILRYSVKEINHFD